MATNTAVSIRYQETTTEGTLQETMEMGPLKSEDQGLGLSVNVVCSELF